MAGHGLALVSRRRFCFCAAPSAVSRQAWRRWNHARIFPYYVFAGHTRAAPDSMATSSTQAVPETRDTRSTSPSSWTATAGGRRGVCCPARRDTPGRAGRPARGRGLRARRRALPDAVRVQLRELAASRRRGLPADAAVRPGAGARSRQAGRAGRAVARDRRSLGFRASAAGTHFRGATTHRHNDRLHLTVAANYGGRWDILQATRAMLAAEPDLAAHPERIDEAHLSRHLSMSWAPERTCSSAPAENNAFPIS